MALKAFDPNAFIYNWSDEQHVPSEQNAETFRDCIREAFNLAPNDNYVYRAQCVTTLDVTQAAINGKRKNGLHDWYHDENRQDLIEPPSPAEIEAYISLFDPAVSLPKALNAFKANSKANTLRALISTHLSSRYHNSIKGLIPNKKERTHVNPYLSLWRYSCRELEWAGPLPTTADTKISHHMLPIFYHHFGCVVPSYTALYVIAKLAQPSKPSREPVKPILDIGSGNGYWAFMLRNFAVEGMKGLKVHAVDSGLSEYRVTWIKDTIKQDGVEFLRKYRDGEVVIDGGKGCVLLLVYPQATGGFTEKMLRAYRGDDVVVAGTQTGNGFTGFQNEMVDQWVEREMPEFKLTLRVPLPSFAAKDEALFVFKRK
ncbi:hypothetical protein CC78DRAFT_619542 [Lojkania enalia]|uniref:Methyltransferase domain-containing protein n=1 Tax=Lojkania enalia TaxID=147567 RepID=A0A9P4N3Z9_9PLEO|nr:hypothetical protein CC78DRAFT_619542 [Didymosphaeria enalia]